MKNGNTHYSSRFRNQLYLAVLLLFYSSVNAQYGHEWMIPGNHYVRLKTHTSGMHIALHNDLVTAGMPPSADPRTFKLYHRGKEQFIQIAGENDGTFNSDDTLFFYGQRNDGTLDAKHYQPSSFQLNKNINLYSDTSVYYLTWGGPVSTKRITTINTVAVTNQDYHFDEITTNFTKNYTRGKHYNANTATYFDMGEGWCGPFFDEGKQPNYNNTFTHTIAGLSNIYTAGPPATLTINIVGANQFNENRRFVIRVGDTNNVYKRDTLDGFTLRQSMSKSFLIPATILTPNLPVYITPIKGSNTESNMAALVSISIRYPQASSVSYSMEKTLFYSSSSTPLHTQVGWTGIEALCFDISNPDSLSLVPYTRAGNIIDLRIPAFCQRLWIGEKNALLKPFSVSGFQFKLPDTTQNFLIVSHTSLESATQEYATYRTSLEGGNYNVSIQYSENLYDVFSFGEFTPGAILNYCNYIRDKNPDAQYLLLIGKSIDLYYFKFEGNHVYYRWNPEFFNNHQDESLRIHNLVPAYGSPASDQYYVMNSVYKPFLSVGRISARDNTQLLNYLEKVKEHEHLDSNYLWRKNLIHLSGGGSAEEINTFKGYVSEFKSKVEGSLWGGKVIKSLHKNLEDGTVSHVSITDEVNAGVSYITYYGHSAPTLTEMDLGNVSEKTFLYANWKKYPMLILNGCASASVYTNYSTAEDWLNTKGLGAVLVFGSSDEAYTDQLRTYTLKYYEAAFNNRNYIGRSAGDIIHYILNSSGIELNTFIRSQMNLHGDPAVRMYTPHLADYEISGDEEDRDDDPEPKVFLQTADGSKLTAATTEFKIGIPIKNFGLYDKDSISITVKRIVNGQTIHYTPIWVEAIRYSDTVFFDIKENNQIGYFGINRFEIYVDDVDSIKEMREDNNFASLNYFMPVSGVSCLFPKEFSIVHHQPITFVAQSTDLMIDRTDYYFELDTSYYFNSRFRRTTVISSGTLVKWENQNLITNQDSVVYYWRVRLNTIPPGQDTVWSTSSFIHIQDSPDGWSQSHPGQFQKDNFKNLSLSVSQNQWTFSKSSQRLMARSYGNGDVNDYKNDQTSVSVGQYRILFPGYWLIPCQGGYRPDFGENTSTEFDGMYAIAFDKSTLEPYLNTPGNKCGRLPFTFLTPFANLSNPSTRSNLINWLNQIPDDYVVLLGSSGNAFFDQWGDKNSTGTIRNILYTNFGATLLDSLNDNEPYILLSVKGGNPIAEKHSNDLFGSVELDTTIVSRFNNGQLYSTLIGPSMEWGTYYKKIDSLDGNDRSKFGIVRYDLNGNSDTLRNLTFHKNQDNIDTLDVASLIPDAKVFPYIKLFAEKYDSATSLTPPQLRKWQVIYQKVPEGTMNPYVAGLTQYADGGKRDEGMNICYTYVFENISDLPFDDSLKVKASIFSPSIGQRDSLVVIKPDSLDPGESTSFQYCFNTKGVSGKATFQMFVNPHLQSEEYYNNNILETSFEIIHDKTPPVIDITFDGIHIMEGDIVSPSPVINISLNDNSKYLLMTDPSKVSLFLKRQGMPSAEQITHTHADIMRYGQDGGNSNTFSIEYKPKNLPDGVHTLIVQGTDVNGNKSGSLFYTTFEVVNASTISNIYPYPNPFSTSTQFVFTLTGSEIPEDMKIQIMTVTGKVVREITKAELGPLHAGNNRTEYAWDGRDEFGDKVANGVYLYRVLLKNKGENFEHRKTAGDKSFTKEFGKIYILR